MASTIMSYIYTHVYLCSALFSQHNTPLNLGCCIGYAGSLGFLSTHNTVEPK